MKVYYFEWGYGETYTVLAASPEDAKQRIIDYVKKRTADGFWFANYSEEERNKKVEDRIKDAEAFMRQWLERADMETHSFGEVRQGCNG